MAKLNVPTRPGALFELLKRKGMTQMDGAQKTGVDRKTLLKINRGGPVKLEKLQDVAKHLRVPEEYFRPLPDEERTSDATTAAPGTLLLRKLDAAHLAELLKGAERVKWLLNAAVRNSEAYKFLEDFETAVDNFQKQHAQSLLIHREVDILSLRDQLNQLKKADDISARFEILADHGVELLGADYLFWDCDSEDGEYEYHRWENLNYRSSRVVLLSVEPVGTLSRRAPIFQGALPPSFSPGSTRNMTITITVNGVPLPERVDDIPLSRTLDDDDLPF